MIHVHHNRSLPTNHEESVLNFAEHFVQEIIRDALIQSSSNSCHMRYEESVHPFQSVNTNTLNSFQSSIGKPNDFIESASIGATKFCNTRQRKKNSLCEEVYTLPVDTVPKTKTKKPSNLEHKCLKPKAIRAFNAIKSSRPRTLCYLKYFLLNLYSANGVAAKKIGSENSAFTKYQCCKRSNKRRTTSQSESKTRPSIRRDSRPAATMKTGGSSNVNRWKACNLFDFKNSVCGVFKSHKNLTDSSPSNESNLKSFKNRSLPPLPCSCEKYDDLPLQDSGKTQFDDDNSAYDADAEFNYGNYAEGCMKKAKTFDFAASIEKVKDCGWYWGPMSSESAEKLLANEKDGSFIVRDSSDDRYIFSLTFKLNSSIMHVRIEHGQGNFSFGNYTNFKSQTIVEFIENTVQHSKSGRYLFFQYRHPVEGPMEVQLLYPVSRFKRVQSLQHMCRFVTLKSVRRDLIPSLPLPKPLIEYLNSKDYYAEEKF